MAEKSTRPHVISAEVRCGPDDTALLDVRRADDGEGIFVQILRIEMGGLIAKPLAHIEISKAVAADMAKIFADLAK